MIIALAGIVCSGWFFQSHYEGFAQDDAYISFRYAANFAHGKGLVFNEGERVEGYSNFLWVIVSSGFIKAGIDPLHGMKVLGRIAGVLLLPLTAFLFFSLSPERKTLLWGLIPAAVFSTSTTLAVWSLSGLEQSAFAFCGWAGFAAVVVRAPVWSFVFLSCTVLLRPEGALFLGISLVYLLVSATGGKSESDEMTGQAFLFVKISLGLVFAVFLGFMGFRYGYYGEFVPNTYFVKGGGGLTNFTLGFHYLKDLWQFNANSVFLSFTPLALLYPGKQKGLKILFAFVVFYLIYLMKIGGDILPMFRLYLTALPAVLIVSFYGFLAIVKGMYCVTRNEYFPWIPFVAAFLGIWTYGAAVYDMAVTTMSHVEYSTVGECLDKAHGEAGRAIARIAREGDLVVGQDMGCMPYNSLKLRYLDSIGLTDATIAKAHYSISYTPYIRYIQWADPQQRQRIQDMESQLREYIFSRNPRFFVINIDIEDGTYAEAMAAIRYGDNGYFASKVASNVFFYGLPQDRRWRQYRLVNGWAYSRVHLLLLYEKQEYYYDSAP